MLRLSFICIKDILQNMMPQTSIIFTCNCRTKHDYQQYGNCLKNNVIYEATVRSKGNPGKICSNTRSPLETDIAHINHQLITKNILSIVLYKEYIYRIYIESQKH